MKIKPHAIEEIEYLIQALQCAKSTSFLDLKGPSEIPDAAGVYIISDNNTGEVLYVGKTTNLRQRIYNNHLMGPLSNARLKKYLIEDERFPDICDIAAAKKYIRNHCTFLYIKENDYRKRGHLEGALSFLCDCRYVDIEH